MENSGKCGEKIFSILSLVHLRKKVGDSSTEEAGQQLVRFSGPSGGEPIDEERLDGRIEKIGEDDDQSAEDESWREIVVVAQ